MRIYKAFLLLGVALAAPSDEALYRRQGVFGGLWQGFLGLFGQSASFDYVIVGGGTAGLTLANRLSQNPRIQVAVVEAGSLYDVTNPLLSSTPAGDVVFIGSDPADANPLVDWNFVTAPQAGANNRQIHYTQGKCLGGSSARNFMIYQRPDRGSLQQWADQVNDQSYTFNNLLPYYKKSTQFTPPSSKRAANASAEFNAAAFSSAGGPLRVSYANYAGPFSSWMERALNAIGIATTMDFNSGSLLGAQYCASTIDPSIQKRDSSQTSFLNAAAGRSNLKVYTGTIARKVLFDNTKKATGVDVTTAGYASYRLQARREVILSAGAFRSPQLLMLSGIGPASTLNNLGIEVLANRPGVGQNMTDHIFFGPTSRVKVQTLTRLANDIPYVIEQFFGPYSQNKEGPLTNPVCDYLGWEKAPRNLIDSTTAAALSRQPASWPDIEYLSAPGYVGQFTNLLTTQPTDGFQYATILGALVAPFSRGSVTISSTNAQDLPVIDPRWLTDPVDQAVAVAAYKRMRQAFATPAMAGVLADKNEYFPGSAIRTDAQILDVIRNTLLTVWHASCTCRMGRKEDPNAVVDSKASVIGVTGLRVVDASAFALLPPGHPQSTIYALAEKIADDILRNF